MMTFAKATRQHAMLRTALQGARYAGLSEAESKALGCSIWSGVVGAGDTNTVGMAVADTTPREYSTLLATDDIAAAFATAALLDAFGATHQPDCSDAARQLARDGWDTFRKLADQAGHQQHFTGADQSAAWPILEQIVCRKADPEAMRRIALLAGRMYAVLKGARAQRVEGVPENVVGTELGGDFGSLVTTEYALLGNPVTARHLLSRVARRQAQQLKRSGRERKARGPLVIALDESGSMKSGAGNRNIWAKSAMTALTRIAWEDRRPVVVVHFSMATRVQRLNPDDYAGLTKAQTTFLSGGTDIGTALDVAGDNVEELQRAGVSGADVVLISDGGDAGRTIEPAVDRLDKLQSRLWSIAIDVPFRGPLRDRASHYVFLDDGKLAADPITEVARAA